MVQRGEHQPGQGNKVVQQPPPEGQDRVLRVKRDAHAGRGRRAQTRRGQEVEMETGYPIFTVWGLYGTYR